MRCRTFSEASPPVSLTAHCSPLTRSSSHACSGCRLRRANNGSTTRLPEAPAGSSNTAASGSASSGSATTMLSSSVSSSRIGERGAPRIAKNPRSIDSTSAEMGVCATIACGCMRCCSGVRASCTGGGSCRDSEGGIDGRGSCSVGGGVEASTSGDGEAGVSDGDSGLEAGRGTPAGAGGGELKSMRGSSDCCSSSVGVVAEEFRTSASPGVEVCSGSGVVATSTTGCSASATGLVVS